MESIISQFLNHTYIFCGDYNLPGITWDHGENGLAYSFSTSLSAHYVPETLTLFSKEIIFLTAPTLSWIWFL
jgi:hypothetical protein